MGKMIIGRRGPFRINFKDRSYSIVLAWDYADAMRIAIRIGGWTSIKEEGQNG
jgi:hypothetical protein